jgi:hypothetical protein
MKKIILSAAFLLIAPKAVQAQTNFSIEPAILEIPYASKSATITVFNSGSESLNFTYDSLYLRSEPKNLLVPEISTPRPLGITISHEGEKTFSLPAGSNKQLTIDIDNQSNSEQIPGIIIQSVPSDIPTDKTTTSLSGAIVVPVIHLGHASAQSLYLNPIKAPFFTSAGGLKMIVETTNPGYTSTIAHGELRVKNIFGKVVARQEIQRNIILPQSHKEVISYNWEPKLLIGAYWIEAEVFYGDKQVQKSKLITGIPVPYTIIISLVMIFVVGICLRVSKYRK